MDHQNALVRNYGCADLTCGADFVTNYGKRMHMRNVHGLRWSHGKWMKTTKDQNRNKRR